ncbi:hypothetical protein [Nocardia brasiliensis]|uniref:MmyB family transcriptional regulator n=1 Tax=Nocardia brasiliensis TaxID=37326 RepID=UPI0024575A7E|nr:hypothetical protein [Nocardia brasiliensis]
MLDSGTPATLGEVLRRLRAREEVRRRKDGTLAPATVFSRDMAAEEAHISLSYLTQLERDTAVGQVGVGILRQLIEIYHASEADWQYVCDLAGHQSPYPGLMGMSPTMEIPTLAQFQEALTPIMRTEMDEASTDLVSYYASPQRQLLAANRRYFEVFPDQGPGLYMLEWTFSSPAARQIMITWDDDARLGVAWHRGIMGRYGKTEWAQQSHRRLWQFSEFRAMWEAGDVAYAMAENYEVRLLIDGRPHGMTMENWHMYNDHPAPILRSRGRIYPL